MAAMNSGESHNDALTWPMDSSEPPELLYARTGGGTLDELTTPGEGASYVT